MMRGNGMARRPADQRRQGSVLPFGQPCDLDAFDAIVDRGELEALAQPLSSTARHVIGLSEVADLPRDEAVAAIVRRTLRVARAGG